MRLNDWRVHPSAIDQSVNFIHDTEDGGLFECRYVRRVDEYFIAYLSSHSGCRHACRFCHLTQTGQTMFTEASIGELQDQLLRVLMHYDAAPVRANRVNINFMARGEPLSNNELTQDFAAFHRFAQEETRKRGLRFRINISSIFPIDAVAVDLADRFALPDVAFYWSLYSLDPGFRKKWLPRAQEPDLVLARLKSWQDKTQGRVTVHWALIEGQNDDDATFDRIAEYLRESGLRANMNLVRYNPHSERLGVEAGPERYAAALDRIGGALGASGSKIVSRVGFDIKASCGMFMRA